jgi:hypothetical protein
VLKIPCRLYKEASEATVAQTAAVHTFNSSLISGKLTEFRWF